MIEGVGSSSRIEGAKLSNREVEQLLSNHRSRSFTTRDEQEVAGYAEVMDTIFDHGDAIPRTENHIKQLHRDLLTHSDKDERHRGAYKTLPNHVEAFDENGRSLGVVFATAVPFDTPRLMSELVSWARKSEKDKTLHSLLVIAVFIVVFLEIHPFQDGNGRLSPGRRGTASFGGGGARGGELVTHLMDRGGLLAGGAPLRGIWSATATLDLTAPPLNAS